MPRDDERHQARALRWVVPLWVAAVLHQYAMAGAINALTLSTVGAGLVWVARPAAPLPALAFALLQAVPVVVGWSATTMRQSYFTAVVHLSLVAALVVGGHRQLWRSWRAPGLVYAAFRQGPLPACLVGFFFAGFAKLNWDFVDPDWGCGPLYYLWFLEHPLLGWLPDGPVALATVGWLAAVGEVVAVPLILLPWTRKWGLACLWVITVALILSPRGLGYLAFAGLFFALSFLLLPPDTFSRWAAWSRAVVMRRQGRIGGGLLHGLYPRRRLLLVAVMGGWLAACWVPVIHIDALLLLRGFLNVIYVPLVAVALYETVRRRASGELRVPWFSGPRLPRRARAAAFWVVGLFALNESLVWVGLYHSPTLTMAANAMFRVSRNNHMLVNPMPELPGLEEVVIIDAQGLPVHAGQHLPWWLFVEIGSQAGPGARVTFRRTHARARRMNGEELRRHFAGGSWAAKLLHFTPYTPGDHPAFCPKPFPGQNRQASRQFMLDAWQRRKRDPP